MTLSDCLRQGDDCEWLLWGRVRYAHPPQQSLLGAQPPHTRTDGQTDRHTHRQPGLPGLRARAQSPVSITLGAPPTRNPPGRWANCHPVGVGERSGRELGRRHGDDGLGAPPRLPVSHRGSLAPPTRNPPGRWANCHPVGVGERSGRELGRRHGDDGLGAPPRLPVSHRGSLAPPTRNPPGSWANCHPVGVGERSGDDAE